MLFSALAYTLIQRLRQIGLAGTALATATAATMRVRLLKIGAALIRNPPPSASCSPRITRALASP